MAEQKIKDAHNVLFEEGLKIRYQVAGKEFVDRSLKNGASDFARPMQEVRLHICWRFILVPLDLGH